MQWLPGFCAERWQYLRNASYASLSEDLANILKKQYSQPESEQELQDIKWVQ